MPFKLIFIVCQKLFSNWLDKNGKGKEGTTVGRKTWGVKRNKIAAFHFRPTIKFLAQSTDPGF